MNLEHDRCLTRDDLSRMLGVSARTVRRLEREGNAPKPIRIGYRTVRYHPDEVTQFMRVNGMSAPAELRPGFDLPGAL